MMVLGSEQQRTQQTIASSFTISYYNVIRSLVRNERLYSAFIHFLRLYQCCFNEVTLCILQYFQFDGSAARKDLLLDHQCSNYEKDSDHEILIQQCKISKQNRSKSRRIIRIKTYSTIFEISEPLNDLHCIERIKLN